MIAALAWVGGRARWILILGCIAALFVPGPSAVLRPFLPGFVAMVYALGMLRVDLPRVMRNLIDPRRALRTWTLALAMTALSALLAFGLTRAAGAGPDIQKAVVYTLLSPPIASAAAMCLLMGLDAALALEMTVLCSFLTPLVAPVMARLLLGDALAVSPVDLGLRTAAMIFSGVAVAMVLRRWIGVEAVLRHKSALDGVSALAMLLFVVPLFDGVGAMIAAAPGAAFGMLALGCALLFLPQLAALGLRRGPGAGIGAAGLAWGVRSVAIFLAALPPDPAFTLFVALYQFPMYATPLLLGAMYARR